MPVFLSHKREDTNQTLSIAKYLRAKDVTCYVDVLDPYVKTTDDLTKLLMERVRQSSHLMAVVSDFTTQSWWVPFEIGVGSELDKRITTFRVSKVALPDFLNKWPVLTSHADLDKFVDLYRLDSTVQFGEARASTSVTSIQSADVFHAALKNMLKKY